MSVKVQILDAVLTIDDSLTVTAKDPANAGLASAIQMGAQELQGPVSVADQAKYVAEKLIERHGGEILEETEPAYFNDPPGLIY